MYKLDMFGILSYTIGSTVIAKIVLPCNIFLK